MVQSFNKRLCALISKIIATEIQSPGRLPLLKSLGNGSGSTQFDSTVGEIYLCQTLIVLEEECSDKLAPLSPIGQFQRSSVVNSPRSTSSASLSFSCSRSRVTNAFTMAKGRKVEKSILALRKRDVHTLGHRYYPSILLNRTNLHRRIDFSQENSGRKF